MIIALVTAVIMTTAPGYGQRAKKPPQPPAPSADPAIAYVVNTNKAGSLMVMNADGSNQKVVISEKNVQYEVPDWSPDGTQLVFTRNIIRGDASIYIINVDGTGLKRVLDSGDGAFEGPVTWSPMPLADGRYKIAFCYSVRRPDGTYEIDNDVFFINLDGTGMVRMTDAQGLRGGSPIYWSPMADMITFPTGCDPETGDGGFAVCQILYIDGVFSLLNLQNNFVFPWGVWANTNNRLATGKDSDIWVLNLLDPSNTAYPVTSTPPNTFEHDRSWSPDDSKILFVQGPSGWLYHINADGSGGLTLISSNDFTWRFPRWRRNL